MLELPKQYPSSSEGASVLIRSRHRDVGRLGPAGWARLFGIMLARVALGTAVVCALCTGGPMAFGWASVMVGVGAVMPRIHPGGVVVAGAVTRAEAPPGGPGLVGKPAKPGHLLPP